MKKSGIYKITNLITERFYIGSSCDLVSRKYCHFWMLDNNNHDNKKLQNSYNKYGKENFKFEVIENCSKDKLIEREQYYLDTLLFAQEYLLKLNNKFELLGYNNRLIAESFKYMNLTKQHKENISKGSKGKIKTEEHREKLRLSHIGQSNHTKEQLEIISKANKNRVGVKYKRQNLQVDGSVMKKITCPHCGLIGGQNNLKRFHFNNCKLNK